MAKKKNKKIIRYRKPLNINVGMIIFALIFVYMSFSVFTYIGRDKIQIYEVVEGGIVNDKIHTGVILRQENIKYTDSAGYISYYIREGKRASVGSKVYSIDETGRLASFLEENPDVGAGFQEENISDLKRQLSAFSMSYHDEEFSHVYDAKYTLEAAVLEFVNFNTLDYLDSTLEQSGVQFKQIPADQAGVVSYVIDSYETLNANEISADTFNRSAYTKSITKSGQLVEIGAPVYKVVTSDLWSLVFPLTEEEKAEYADRTSLTITFLENNLTTTSAFSFITGTDGNTYGKLDFDKYMVQFISDRFVDFEIATEKVDGLKIPTSAVMQKDFFLVPIEYLSQGGDSSESGFYKEVYSESGTASIVFVPTTLYNSTDEYYYIDMGDKSGWKAGDYIVKPESTQRYQIGPSASLQGVYNINKGYSVFKQIEILASNNEYHIVKKNMNFGLSVYDHIVLDGDAVAKEGELIYQ